MWTTCVYVNFMQQVLLICLFWNLGNPVNKPDYAPEILEEDNDLQVPFDRTDTLCEDSDSNS
jgi:hypothetical protein